MVDVISCIYFEEEVGLIRFCLAYFFLELEDGDDDEDDIDDIVMG